MKAALIIIFLIFFQCASWSQRFVKTTTPCSNELLKTTPGQWIHWGDPITSKNLRKLFKENFEWKNCRQ
ncbi:MAG TPA: hypothetical protein VKC90_03970 [Chitinophagaceae bacterium]|nr:hypothetical protein [Chitinophagaceae bacterium]